MIRVNRNIAVLLIGGCLLAGCATTVSRVTADPSRYRNRDVTVTGNVVDSVSVLGRGAYRIEDNTGSLWVVSMSGVPREGARVSVKGRVQDGFNLNLPGGVNLPAGLSSGIVLMETSHVLR